jgi:DNA-binding GntR family transcriptional regulator
MKATEHPELLIDDVYARVRDLILSNVLRAGQKLVDRDLADRLGVSRTPVREALGRLQMVGLVISRPRRGYYVIDFTAKEVTDLFEFRQVLEVTTAKLAARNAQPSHLREFSRILDDLENLIRHPKKHAAAVDLDLKVHELIARASGNAPLHDAMRNVLDKVTCFMWMDDVTVSEETIVASHRQHQSLLRLISAGDAEGAGKLIYTHIDNAKERLQKVLAARNELQQVFEARNALRKAQRTAPTRKRGSRAKALPNGVARP